MSGSFHFAPPAYIDIDRYAAGPTRPPPRPIVPIDIQTIDATITLDPSTAIATGHATLTFGLGASGGFPFFDLRQPIQSVSLDGRPLDAAASILRIEKPSGPDGLVLAVPLPAWSGGHQLELEYGITQPPPQLGSETRLKFDTASREVWLQSGFNDGSSGHYLEQWVPANLLFDQFSLRLTIRVVGGAGPHTLVANGHISGSGNTWQVVYPDSYNSACPFMRIAPTNRLSSWWRTTTDRAECYLVAETKRGVEGWLEKRGDEVIKALSHFTTLFGPRRHQDPFICVFSDDGNAMEYGGAAWSTVGSLCHEISHSWFGRGLMPPMGRDNWIDEAIAVYLTNPNVGSNGNPPTDHVCLAPVDPWSRCGPRIHYPTVGGMMKYLDEATGGCRMKPTLRDIYACKLSRNEWFLGTEEFEARLSLGLGDPGLVKSIFAKFVYCT